MLALKLGISLNNIKVAGGGIDITQMIIDFYARALADGATETQGTACLTLLLTNLNDIS